MNRIDSNIRFNHEFCKDPENRINDVANYSESIDVDVIMAVFDKHFGECYVKIKDERPFTRHIDPERFIDYFPQKRYDGGKLFILTKGETLYFEKTEN